MTLPTTVGESVMNTAMALEVLHNYGEVLALAGAPSAVQLEVARVRADLEEALWSMAWNDTAGKRGAHTGIPKDHNWVAGVHYIKESTS